MRETEDGGVCRRILRRCARCTRALVTVAALFLIRCYQAFVRPFLVGACKFHPSCSTYAADAISLHGPWRGIVLAARRLARCHPFSPGGIDPVPQPQSPDSTPGDDAWPGCRPPAPGRGQPHAALRYCGGHAGNGRKGDCPETRISKDD